MALSESGMAQFIADAMEETTVSDEILCWATNIVLILKTEAYTSTRYTASHSINGFTSSSLVSKMVSCTYGSATSGLSCMCNAIATHISTGVVTFENPTSGSGYYKYYLDGVVEGLDGAAMASLVFGCLPQSGVSPELLKFTTAICDYITDNAEGYETVPLQGKIR